jgi:hypothetical protein
LAQLPLQDGPSEKRFNIRYSQVYFEFTVPEMSAAHIVSSLENRPIKIDNVFAQGLDYRASVSDAKLKNRRSLR